MPYRLRYNLYCSQGLDYVGLSNYSSEGAKCLFLSETRIDLNYLAHGLTKVVLAEPRNCWRCRE
jgi:hypothetical protein